MDFDPRTTAGLVTRSVSTGKRHDTPTRLLIASRTYSTDQADLWDAMTNPERIRRWFLPVTGDLAPGGNYQLDGNAGGTIQACTAPESFEITWEYGGSTSWLTINLSPVTDGTTLELVHESPLDPDFWKRYGPAATGLGWDLATMALGQYVEAGKSFNPDDEAAFCGSSSGALFLRSAATAWADAAIANGDEGGAAREAAARSVDFYSPPADANSANPTT